MTTSRRKRTTQRARLAAVLALLLCLVSNSAQAASPRHPDHGFYVARFENRIDDSDRLALARTGAKILGYEPDDSYLVWADSGEIRQARATDGIASIVAVGIPRKIGINPSAVGSLKVNVVTMRSAATTVASSLSSSAAAIDGIHPLDRDLAIVTITTAYEDIQEIARRRDVLFIEPASRGLDTEDEMTTQLIAGNLDDERRAVRGYGEWLEKLKLTGKGVRVSIADTGISESHPDIAGRIAKTYDYGDAPVQETPYDVGGHGTHVAGIVAGKPSGSGALYSDPDGFLYGQGVAPEVELVNQNVISMFGPGTGGSDNHVRFRGFARDAVEAGARIWNSSWHTGQGNRAGYLPSVRVFDELSRDVLPETKALEEFLFVFSAGNGGSSGPTVPKEAKNIVAVGSTHSGRGIQYPLETNPERISSFSSVGPTKDGRIFPTVVAPGSNVVSARSIEGSTIGCATPIEAVVHYCSLSGTSMAAPHVAGAAALIHQWWKQEHGALPSPAIVKALLVNSATDIGVPDIPNIGEGWGRVNLGTLFAPGPRVLVDQSVIFPTRRGSRSYNVRVPKRGPLKITLAWSDAPANIGADKVLVNDLDLVVDRISRSQVADTYRGNVFSGGESTGGGERDRLNNLENVYLLDAPPGNYRITVKVANLPGDGVPGNGDRTDQDFALVIDGAR